jgi:hypothetical protein
VAGCYEVKRECRELLRRQDMRIKPPLAQARISAARRKSQPGTDFARVRTKIQQEKVRKAQSRTVKRNPDFGVCGVFQRFFRTFWSWDTNATHNILHLFLCSAQGKARPEPFARSKIVLAPQTKAQTEDKEGQEVSSNVTITVSSSAQRLSRESPTACKPAE